mgnify:FL=1
MFLIIFIGVIYLIIGFISIFTALMFIELGRPKDLMQSGLIILLGTFLIIYRNIFTLRFSFVLTLNAVLINFYFFENFSYRWNQLLDKEKYDIKSLSGFKKNFSVIINIIRVDFRELLYSKIKSFFKNSTIKKKWIRPKDNNATSSLNKESSKESMNNIQSTDFSTEDMIYDDKNNTKNTKLDK